MEKYILLDIDGVMVPAAGWKPVEFDSDGFYQFNYLAQKKLDWLLEETGAAIILITSHRNRFSRSEWNNVFNKRFKFVKTVQSLDDLDKRKVVKTAFLSADQSFKSDDRLADVLDWVKLYGSNSKYVIIDDDSSLESLPAQIKDHWVRTSSTVGLNEATAKKALSILNTL